MLKRYAVWDKETPIITPVGEVLSAEQWKDRYPVARLDNVVIVCGAGEVNGSFFGTLGQMQNLYENQGCDFTGCNTPEEYLAAIEKFEDDRNNAVPDPSAEERIAAALEYQNLASM